MTAAQPSRSCDEEIRDAIVIGGGPAGLSAALVLGRCLRRVLICDAGHPRNESARIFNGFLSRDGSTPAEFLQICRDQLRRYETIEFRKVKVMDVERGDCRFTVMLETGECVTSRMLYLRPDSLMNCHRSKTSGSFTAAPCITVHIAMAGNVAISQLQ
jgi:NADPH-dependent 2,4-dienoyl-CoA reductase/sulfur reductase-like enzyme